MCSFVIGLLIGQVEMFDKVFNTDQWFAIEPEPKQINTYEKVTTTGEDDEI